METMYQQITAAFHANPKIRSVTFTRRLSGDHVPGTTAYVTERISYDLITMEGEVYPDDKGRRFPGDSTLIERLST